MISRGIVKIWKETNIIIGTRCLSGWLFPTHVTTSSWSQQIKYAGNISLSTWCPTGERRSWWKAAFLSMSSMKDRWMAYFLLHNSTYARLFSILNYFECSHFLSISFRLYTFLHCDWFRKLVRLPQPIITKTKPRLGHSRFSALQTACLLLQWVFGSFLWYSPFFWLWFLWFWSYDSQFKCALLRRIW